MTKRSSSTQSASPLKFISLIESLDENEAARAVVDSAVNSAVTPSFNSSARKNASRRLAPRSETRIEYEAAVVLHSYPYSETSLILDVYSRAYGRIALVAKGAKRPRSVMRGVLAAFQPLLLSWSGRGEVRTLTKAEWTGGQPPLVGDALLMGFYLNELLIKLLPRDDAHPELFDTYLQTLAQLAQPSMATLALRGFERALLQELGYAIHYSQDIHGDAIHPQHYYRIDPEAGAVPTLHGADQHDALVVQGQTLLDLENNFFDANNKPRSQQAKFVMRALINHLLAGQSLNTRQILIDIQKL